MQGETGAVNRTAYLPGLDGLRALAVLAVLAYHADPDWLPGGFLGVEVFFVISGFIITRGLLGEWRQSGGIQLRSFWRRRALRLLPALFLLLAGVLTYALLFEPGVVADLRVDVLAALGYVTNWRLIFDNQSYFDSWQQPSMLRHLWSLAIEEQFYLFWPLLLWLCLGRIGSRLTAVLTLLLALAAFGNMAWQFQDGGLADASRLYYGSDTRIGALLIGAVLAFLPIAQPQKSGRIRIQSLSLAGLMSVGLLALYAVELDENNTLLYQGGFLMTTLATCVLVLAMAVGTGFLARLLGLPPLRWIGQRSYGIYLWHWPIFLLTWPRTPSLALFAAETLAAIAIAAISYRFLEQPIRHGALGRLLHDVNLPRPSLRIRAAGLALSGVGTAVLVLGIATAMAVRPPVPESLAQSEIRITSSSASLVGSDVSSLLPSVPTFGPVTSREPLPTPVCEGMHGDPYGPRSEVEWAEVECLGEQAAASPTTEPSPTATPPPVTATPAPSTGVQVQPPTPLTPEQVQGLVSAVGDSVMLGAAYDLAAFIPNIDVDASVGRQVSTAIGILQQRSVDQQLGATLLLHLGNNGTFTSAQFDQIMAIAGPDRQVYFMNLHVPRDWEGSNNQVIAAGVERYANAHLIDWAGVSVQADGVFIDDQVHLQRTGAWLYTEVVQAALSQ